MKKIAVFLLIFSLIALGGVAGLRFLGLAATPTALEAPPGEGRLDRQGDPFAGLFRSWSLGGRETAGPAQEEALLRLGMTRGSKLIRQELRRRELERLILEAESRLAQVRATAPPPEPEAVYEEDIPEEAGPPAEGWPEGAAPAEGDQSAGSMDSQTGGDFASAVMTPEETAARESLAKLKADYARLLNELSPAALAAEKDRLAEVALLSGGAARGARALLTRWGQPFHLVEAGPGLAGLAKRHPVLVVPTGALGGKTGGPVAAYTRAGGTVISFAQRRGVELAGLPGRPHGFGWEETESAYENAVEVAAAHPSTVACGKARFSAAVDGFFTDLPQGAEVLLRATGSGQPVAVAYPYGQGQVIATTLYTDWAAMNQPAGQDEYGFLRDLVLWAVARSGKRFHPSLTPLGAKVQVTLPLVNLGQHMATKVRLSYLTPEGRFCKPFELDLRMLPEEKEDKTITVYAPRSPGIWHLVYALVGPDGSIMQYWRNGVDLACGQPAVAPAPTGLGAAVTSTGEILRGEKGLTLTVNLWNHGSSPVGFSCTGPTGKISAEVPAGGGKKLAFRLPVARQATAKGYYEFDLSSPDGLSHLVKLVTTTPAGRKGGSR